jgi:hypothetical protein
MVNSPDQNGQPTNYDFLSGYHNPWHNWNLKKWWLPPFSWCRPFFRGVGGDWENGSVVFDLIFVPRPPVSS